jgi:hypothetical protein
MIWRKKQTNRAKDNFTGMRDKLHYDRASEHIFLLLQILHRYLMIPKAYSYCIFHVKIQLFYKKV